jgi:hypothetical protein
MAIAHHAENWRHAYEQAFVRVRDQLRAERAAGGAPRRAQGAGRGVDMRNFSDSEIDRYARHEAERRVQEAMNRHVEEVRQRRAA